MNALKLIEQLPLGNGELTPALVLSVGIQLMESKTPTQAARILAKQLDALLDFHKIAPGPGGVALEAVDRAVFQAALTLAFTVVGAKKNKKATPKKKGGPVISKAMRNVKKR